MPFQPVFWLGADRRRLLSGYDSLTALGNARAALRNGSAGVNNLTSFIAPRVRGWFEARELGHEDVVRIGKPIPLATRGGSTRRPHSHPALLCPRQQSSTSERALGWNPALPVCSPDGVIWSCDAARGCLEPMQTCKSADVCVDGGRAGAFCAVGPDSCAALQEAYTARLERLYRFPITSAEPGSGPLAYNCERCSVVAGHCGLGSCWYVTAFPLVDDPEPQRIADLYRRLGCGPELACDCGPAPDNIECLSNVQRFGRSAGGGCRTAGGDLF